MTKSGLPHTVGRLSSPVYRYVCLRCHRPSKITSIEFNSLPRMTADEIAQHTDLPAPVTDPHLPASA